MRAILVGTPSERARLKSEMNGSVDVVGEFVSFADARAASVDADAIIVASYVDKFRDEFQAHIDRGGCPFGDSSPIQGIMAPIAQHAHELVLA